MVVRLAKALVVVARQPDQTLFSSEKRQPENQTLVQLMNRTTSHIVILISTLLLSGWTPDPNQMLDYSGYERLLKTYTEENGVRYAAWAKNEEDLTALKEFVEYLGQVDIDTLSEAEQVALYINLYNAAMLQIVLENYPLESVKTIGILPFSVFKKDRITLGDSKLSLDDIEKGILLRKYFDPRIHFAVNCASKSCPPLRTEPFTGNRLADQLQEQTELFAQSERAARVDEETGSIAYSSLFKWYADDFAGETPSEYLNQYRNEALPTNYFTKWIPYDWSLNEIEEE